MKDLEAAVAAAAAKGKGGANAQAALHLQRVFRGLHQAKEKDKGRSNAAVDTRALVQSLGINTSIQEDAQEFYLRLVNALEGLGVSSGSDSVGDGSSATDHAQKQKGQDTKSSPASVLAGETTQVLHCPSVAYTRSKPQRFLDLSVDVDRFDSVEASLRALFTEKEEIEGYRAGEHGLQTAVKSLKLTALPQALCVHLKR